MSRWLTGSEMVSVDVAAGAGGDPPMIIMRRRVGGRDVAVCRRRTRAIRRELRGCAGRQLPVVGTRGDLELDPGFKFETATKLQLRRDGKITETQFPQIDHFGAPVAYFSDSIAAGTPPEADGEEGLACARWSQSKTPV